MSFSLDPNCEANAGSFANKCRISSGVDLNLIQSKLMFSWHLSLVLILNALLAAWNELNEEFRHGKFLLYISYTSILIRSTGVDKREGFSLSLQ